MGGAGVFNFPLQEHFLLEDPEWKYDVMPEIMDGKNVADFIDADIERKLMELEREEEMLLLGRNITEMDREDPEEEELLRIQKGINVKKTELKIEHRLNRNKRAFSRNVELKDMEDVLNKTGKDVSSVHEKFKKRTKPKPLTSTYKRQDDQMEEEKADGVFADRGDRDPATRRKIEKKLRTFSRSRSKGNKRELSVNDREVENLRVKIQNREFKNLGKAGEADRHVPITMPKHLFSGKRGNGKNDRR
jgi:nucleolar GTP-binding protein